VCCDEGTPVDRTLDLLASLVDKSLVSANLAGSEPRYDVLESFREYGRDRLESSGALNTLKRRHARYYFELFTRLSPMRGTAEEAWVARVSRDVLNLRAVLHWALSERGDVELGQRLVGQLARDKALDHKYTWARAAMALADADTPTVIRAMLAHAEAWVAKMGLEYRAELESSRRADTLYREVGDVYGSLKVKELIGHALLSLGEIDEAELVLQEALTPARKEDDPILVGDILRALSGVYGKRGAIVASRAYADEAISVFERGGATLHAAYALDDRAECEFLAGRDPAAAKLVALRSVAAARAMNNDYSTALARNALAVYEIALAQYTEAAANVTDTLEYARAVSHNVLVAWSLQHLAAIAALRTCIPGEDASIAHMQAARIVGFVDEALIALRAGQHFTQHEEHDRTLAALRDALGAELLEKLRTEGAAMTEDEAVEKALAL
jgi:hypothetical protein